MEEGKMKDKMIVSTDNIFADLCLSDSEEMQTRSDLMSEVVNIIRKSDLPQKEIAKLLEISAPKVSSLMSGKINDFSNDTLMNYLTLLGCNIEIRVVPKNLVSKSVKRGKMKVKRPAARRRKSTPSPKTTKK